MSEYTQSYRKYLLSLLFLSLYGTLYKNSKMVGLVKTVFDSVLFKASISYVL